MGWTMAHIFKLLYATKHSIILTEYFFTSSFTKPYLGKKIFILVYIKQWIILKVHALYKIRILKSAVVFY